MKRRLRRGLIALLFVVAACTFVAAAGADSSNSGLPGALKGSGAPAFLPQETNIASLAWRGEELRFVKCSPAIPAGGVFDTDGVPSGSAPNTINFFVEDFSGDPHFQPHPVVGTFSYATSHNDVQCVRGDFVSNKPGLAMIKLVVTDELGDKVLEHQFLAGWMSIGATSLSPTGTVEEPAGTDIANDFTIQVSGNIPLDEEWQSDWGLPAQLTMPNDWPLLASKIASTSRDLRASNPSVPAYKYWDIHDSSGPESLGGDGGEPDIHVSQTTCPGSDPSTTIDQVDNCDTPGLLGLVHGQSRVFGDTAVFPVVGPFDPQYPENTLLSDGNLNALDAPMPNLRIDVNSAGNTGFIADVGEASTLGNVKFCVYSRSHCGTGFGAEHDFYAPFYAAWIPATYRNQINLNGDIIGRSPDASGTDGPQPWYTDGTHSFGNNFEGYLAGNRFDFDGEFPAFVSLPGLYLYWQLADILTNAEGGDTACLLRMQNGEPIFRQLNEGPQSAVVYTDEHGEARVSWVPGLNNDLFGDLTPDDNGACDVEGLDLGGATISAQARYPFQNVAGPVGVPGEITKVVQNLFHKGVECRLKNNGPNGGLVYICTASAQDIDGSGTIFNGEEVCISTEPGRQIYPFPRGDSRGETNELCVELSGGTRTTPATASVEFSATLVGTLVDVAAYFVDERIWRDTCITVGQEPSVPGPCGTATAPSPGGGGAAGGGSNTGVSVGVVSPSNSTTSIQGATEAVKTNSSTKAIKASVVSVKTVKVRNGRALVVKVQSPRKTATIRITLVGKHGKVLVRAVRTIKANKAVRVQRLLVPKAVKAVHVSVLR